VTVEPLHERLRSGLRRLGEPALDDRQQRLLLDYLDLLRHWGRSYNLTAVSDPGDMVELHLLDSLSIAPWAGPGPLLDAGTGAGLPGLPLAVALPDLKVTLLDSSGKKIRFLRHVKRVLRLENVFPVQARLESFRPEHPFEAIVSRAFSSLSAFAAAARPLCDAGTRLLAMKGRHPREELDALPDWIVVQAVEKLRVPGLQADRHLVIMSVIA
jgi:16S rRNA (guanine527-N7)-methyltransferase